MLKCFEWPPLICASISQSEGAIKFIIRNSACLNLSLFQIEFEMFGLDLNPTDWWNQNRIIAAGLIFAWCQISLVLVRIWSTIQPKAKLLLRLHKVISYTDIWKKGWVLIHLYSWKRPKNSIAKLLCMLWSWIVSNRLIY